MPPARKWPTFDLPHIHNDSERGRVWHRMRIDLWNANTDQSARVTKQVQSLIVGPRTGIANQNRMAPSSCNFFHSSRKIGVVIILCEIDELVTTHFFAELPFGSVINPNHLKPKCLSVLDSQMTETTTSTRDRDPVPMATLSLFQSRPHCHTSAEKRRRRPSRDALRYRRDVPGIADDVLLEGSGGFVSSYFALGTFVVEARHAFRAGQTRGCDPFDADQIVQLDFRDSFSKFHHVSDALMAANLKAGDLIRILIAGAFGPD